MKRKREGFRKNSERVRYRETDINFNHQIIQYKGKNEEPKWVEYESLLNVIVLLILLT